MSGRQNESLQAAAWILGAALPALCDMSFTGTLAWAAAIMIGAHLANGHLLRWVAAGWAASAVVPAAPVVVTVASGSTARRWLDYLGMAGIGLLGALLWPDTLRNAGVFLLIAGTILVVSRRNT